VVVAVPDPKAVLHFEHSTRGQTAVHPADETECEQAVVVAERADGIEVVVVHVDEEWLDVFETEVELLVVLVQQLVDAVVVTDRGGLFVPQQLVLINLSGYLDVQSDQHIFDLAVVCIQIASQQLFELFAWVINDYSLTDQSIA
jgi:hypothetical protein